MVSLVLLGASAGLAAILQHDGVGLDARAAADAPLGSHVRMRGQFQPDDQPASRPSVLPDESFAILDGLLPREPFHYLLHSDGVMLMVLSPSALPARTILVSGSVVGHVVDPANPGMSLTVVHADSWTQPILFG